jgi:Kef-type K+ transport system membrane component KefB
MFENKLPHSARARRRFAIAAHYLALVGVPGLALLGILYAGRDLPALPIDRAIPPAQAGPTAPMPDLLLLLGQVALIIAAARGVGRLFRALRQPQVVGEMAAGILLGPSLLGWLAPEWFHALFPPASLGFLNSISQIGLLVFMFLVGVELDPQLLRGRGAAVVVTSHASIAVPFVLGAGLAYGLYPRLAPGGVSFVGFALFLGAAMSVTAFPVLARILAEKNLARTRVGAAALACAAIDDVTAWSILAAVVLLVRAGTAGLPLWATLGGSALFVAAMLCVARPVLRRFGDPVGLGGGVTCDRLALVLIFALLSALVTEWLGIHALFGAFLAGAVMPRETAFAQALKDKLEDQTVVLLLPLFFAFTGLRTQIGLVSGAELWAICGLVVLAAVAGKLGGSAVAARLAGMPWREAGALGVLMNTRGLMELVILNVGLDIGVISPTLFTMMVFMALATTCMTTPLLALVYPAATAQGSVGRGESRNEGAAA